MNDIYRLGEMIIEELDSSYLKGVYKVTSIENMYDDDSCLRDRKVSVVELHTNSLKFWKIILDMMKKVGCLESSADELEEELEKWEGER